MSDTSSGGSNGASDAEPRNTPPSFRVISLRVSPRVPRAIALSVLAHGLVCALWAWHARRHPLTPDAPTLAAVAPVELTFEEPPPPPPAPPEPAAPPAAAASPPPRAPAPVRAARDSAPTAPSPVAPAPLVPAPEPVVQPPAPTPAPAPRIDAMALLRTSRDDVAAAAARDGVVFALPDAPRPTRDLVTLPTGTPLERARAASAGYVAARLDEAPPRPEAPGVRTYYWHLRRRMQETWRPGVSREPSIGQTILATLGMPTSRAQEATEVAMGAGAHPGRAGSTMQAADDAHGGNASTRPTVQPFVGIADLAQVNRQVTRAEVQVDQDEAGRVLDIRMIRSSRIPSYDRAALQAVREALPLQTPARMPGGRRSRWSFETVASRAPFVPGVGMIFDESSGWFEVVYPGRVFTRSRVWLESARPL